ncbi:hypothetical protein PHSY_007317 [Pseudozyma hubeiensis SY62]|uniref:JmjC domain-containing protein n=1 Tax=Pseudozyma hubeiensis (strain SY62) TaxID=1305764 RepID=R9PEC5_PSEHS|nr:hypothetical protein PHSY_007317 [Pseudozyma hubeiensis SY62]GAC99714.1 hypothetical protein PHSY_007317 [Pseudozyma hubeiensis SY62]
MRSTDRHTHTNAFFGTSRSRFFSHRLSTITIPWPLRHARPSLLAFITAVLISRGELCFFIRAITFFASHHRYRLPDLSPFLFHESCSFSYSNLRPQPFAFLTSGLLLSQRHLLSLIGVVPQRSAARRAEDKLLLSPSRNKLDRDSADISDASIDGRIGRHRSAHSSSAVTAELSSAIPVSSGSAETSLTALRTTSKRGAAQAAQNNISRSYLELPLDELIAPSHKRSRPSTSSRTKGSTEDQAGRSRPKTTSKVAASSQAANRRRRLRDDQGLLWEVQLETCQVSRYGKWRRCVSCVSKKSGDTCRFAGFRAIPVNPDTDEPCVPSETSSIKPAFLSSPDPDEVMDLPTDRALAAIALKEAQANVARALLPVLEAELQHARQDRILRRPRETTCRQMCEFCATSIFSASYYCSRCGREYCPDCKDAIQHPDHSDVIIAKRLVQCDRVRGHNVDDLVPLTRFDVKLLEEEVAAMRNMLAAVSDDTVASTNKGSRTDPAGSSNAGSTSSSGSEDQEETPINWKEIPNNRAGLAADALIGSLSLRAFDASSFDTHQFRKEWAHGEPLLVRDVTARMQHAWGPDTLAARYGEESCFVVRSDTDPPQTEQVSVGEFFSTFGQDTETKQQVLGKGSWKLKDWPPSAEFKHEFPELYQDFNRAVPAPEYTTREGILNLGSCYPTGVIQPDLGPKMYNAWPASEAVRGQGTTRLHMDIADAVNIMLYAAPLAGDDVAEEHRPGVAAWDIFRAEDAEMLRAFLREEHAKLNFQDDPIHIQRFFISAPQRVKLYRKYGLKSWRIYQKAGEAVFIPAGCVKVAVDFVSPQNVERCFKLTAEFREMVKDYKKAWKEDVLSLRTTLWYAWCTYREMDDKGPNVWAKQAARVKSEEEQRITKKILQDA